MTTPPKRVCTICKYGDGKWDEGRPNVVGDDDLPVCDLCKKDGWTVEPKEIVEAMLKDPVLKNYIYIKSSLQL